jgi:ABC-2 type transport system ATP-binding protein
MSTVVVTLVVLAGAFEALCLFDIVRSQEVRYLPKWVWAIICLGSIPLGGIVYLILRRRVEAPESHPPVAEPTWPPNGDSPPSAPSVTPGSSQPKSASTIEIDRLSKCFGSVVAVDDLSFEVRPGCVTGFLGPNGAGKTTTLRIVLGLQAPTSGRTALAGRSYQNVTRPLHRVGALLDGDAAHPGRSAWMHILSVAQSNGIGLRRAEAVVELTGLSDVAHRRLREFSLGMKQRLGIAIALLGDPPILLFDEPLNGLDPERVRWIRELFKSLAAEGRTVFVSSHLMSEMALTADHLIIIGRGRLLADTSTQAFVEANARQDVFVGSPQAAQLADLLTHAGAGVVGDGGDGGLSVTGMDAAEIARVGSAHSIAIYELTPRHASLEDAYLDLTRDSVEYPAGISTTAQSRGER